MTESNMNNSEKTTFDFFNYEFNDNKNYKSTHLGEKHTGTIGEYYDIKISDSNFIKLYHSNRNIDMSRVITMCDKFKVKLFDFPPLIVAHIVDIEYDKDEYVLIDGQHRYSTIKELNFRTKIDYVFTYKLYQCNSVEELEELFTDINSNIKFDNMFPFKKLGKLMDKIELYFKASISNAKMPQSHKFNPKYLKDKLSTEKFFEVYDNTVEEVYKKILELNDNIMKEIFTKKMNKKLSNEDQFTLYKIELNKKNPMYLLMKDEFKWIDDLKLLLAK